MPRYPRNTVAGNNSIDNRRVPDSKLVATLYYIFCLMQEKNSVDFNARTDWSLLKKASFLENRVRKKMTDEGHLVSGYGFPRKILF